MLIQTNEKWKKGIMSLSDIVGIEKNEKLIKGEVIEIDDTLFENLSENYKEALNTIEETEND